MLLGFISFYGNLTFINGGLSNLRSCHNFTVEGIPVFGNMEARFSAMSDLRQGLYVSAATWYRVIVSPGWFLIYD